jgi:YD repeat-containing protein
MGWLRKVLGRGEPEPEPPPLDLDPSLLTLLEAHGLPALDRQLRFADLMGDPDWHLDQANGLLRLGAQVFPAQVLGTTSWHSGTWLWAWANPSIAEPLTTRSREAARIGEERGLPLLTTASVDLDTVGDAHFLALAVGGLLGADAYYRCPHDAGEVVVLLDVPSIRGPVAHPEVRALTVVPRSATVPGVLGAASIAGYLRWLGLPVTETEREVRIGDGTAGTFTYDELGRLTGMTGTVSAGPA